MMKIQAYYIFTIILAVSCLTSAQVTFTPITEGAIVEDTGHFVGYCWWDYDNDGYMDVIVANSGVGGSNHLYHNDGDGSFSRITEGILVTDRISAIGPAIADMDNDGDMDLFVATQDNSVDVFYRNEGDGIFCKVTEGDWVNTPSKCQRNRGMGLYVAITPIDRILN